MAVKWPSILRPRSILFEPQFNNRSGGMSLTGLEPVVTSGAGLWRAVYGGVTVRIPEHVKALRGLSVQLEGRAGTVLVPILDKPRNPGPVENGKILRTYGRIPHSDGAFFQDTTGYRQPLIRATVAAPANARLNVVAMDIQYGGLIEPGQHFSIGERLYRIKTVLAASSIYASVEVWPPLRESISPGMVVEFDQPVCRMRLASDDALDLDLDFNRFGSPTVSFIEAL